MKFDLKMHPEFCEADYKIFVIKCPFRFMSFCYEHDKELKCDPKGNGTHFRLPECIAEERKQTNESEG